MADITLNVYENDFITVKKTAHAQLVKVPFGAVRKLMSLLNVENLSDTKQILNVALSSWDSIVSILDRVFPDIEPEEWDYVDTKELVQVLFNLLKFGTSEILTIPTDPKN